MMGCPRCKEPHNVEILFSRKLPFPSSSIMAEGETKIMYDFTFLRCNSCKQEYAIRDDGLVNRKAIEGRKKIRECFNNKR